MLVISKANNRNRTEGAIPLAVIRGGQHDKQILFYEENATREGDQQVNLPQNEIFEPLPETRPGMRSVWHVCGSSGAGKSTVAGKLAENFTKIFPDSQIFVISSTADDDPAFSKVDHQRINVDESLNDIQIDKLCDKVSATLLIFDDVEGVAKERKKALENFSQRALETGRKFNCHVVSLFHRPASGGATKISLNESNGFIYFPKNPPTNLSYVFKSHLALPIGLITLLKDFGKFVLIRTDNAPSYILGSKKACIYDPEKADMIITKRRILNKEIAKKEADEEIKKRENNISFLEDE